LAVEPARPRPAIPTNLRAAHGVSGEKSPAYSVRGSWKLLFARCLPFDFSVFSVTSAAKIPASHGVAFRFQFAPEIVPSSGLAVATALSMQVASMADASPSSPPSVVATDPAGLLPEVRIELHRGGHPPVLFQVPEAGFLIGSVPGCDLRLPGTNLPPVICL